MDPQHGLAHGAEGIRQVELRHDDAFEHVRRLPHHHGIDLMPVKARVVEGALRRLAHEARDGDVEAFDLVLGLADSDHCAGLGHG